MRVCLTAVSLLLALAPVAHADLLEFSADFSTSPVLADSTPVSFGDVVSFQQFDTARGALNAVRLEVRGRLSVTASIGLVSFLSFLAVISVSLGVLNLLPVPMLDGGHLFYYLIEVFKGSPVSEQTEIIGQKIGILLLFGLMSVAIYNDLLRLVE